MLAEKNMGPIFLDLSVQLVKKIHRQIVNVLDDKVIEVRS